MLRRNEGETWAQVKEDDGKFIWVGKLPQGAMLAGHGGLNL
jgi:hypothetical protein